MTYTCEYVGCENKEPVATTVAGLRLCRKHRDLYYVAVKNRNLDGMLDFWARGYGSAERMVRGLMVGRQA